MPALWLAELSLFPLLSRAISGVVFWHVCELSMTLVNLLLLLGTVAVSGKFQFIEQGTDHFSFTHSTNIC